MNYLQKKKLAFMSIVNSVKGFVRTVLGISPLTLPDCVDTDSIINYKIDGNSVQDGTPTPETPVEVESVGDKTANLLSGINRAFSILSTYTIADNVLTITPTSKNAYQTYVSIKLGDLELGKTYTVSWNIDFNASSGAKPLVRVGYHGASNKWSDIKARTTATSGRYNITFTLPETMPEDMQSFGFCMLFNYTSVAATELVDYKIYDIMLVSGDTATDYEPFGYKIPVKCSGKNLFDMDALIEQILSSVSNDSYAPFTGEEDGRKYIAIAPPGVSSAGRTFALNCKPNTRYTFSFYGKVKSGSNNMYLYYTNGDREYINITSTDWERYTVISDENKTVKSILFVYQHNEYVYYSDFQLEEGTVVTDYEPYQESVTANIYLDEPLRRLQYTSTGYHSDYIDFEKGVVRRRIYEKIFNGSEIEIWNVWTASITDNTMGVYYRKESELGTYANQKVLSGYGLSNYFRNTASAMNTQKDSLVGYVCVNGNSNPPYIAFKVPFVAKEDWVEWLKTKYEMGDPLKVYWIWREASMVETPITLPKLPTIKGTTIYSIDTEVQPSNMEVTYYSTSKE